MWVPLILYLSLSFLLLLLLLLRVFYEFSFSISSSSSSLSFSFSFKSSMTINGETIESNHHQQTDSNEPVESFYLSKEEEIDWLNKNAFFFERKDSTTKRKSISNSTNSILSSISLKSKPGASSIIGLPKPQKSCFTIRKNCKPSKVRFFPKRSSNRNKSSSSSSVPPPPPSEPSSPKVSCIGRVRSKKEQRSRSLRIHHDQIHHNNNNRSTEEKTEMKNPKPNKTGFWSNFKAVLRIGCRKPNVNEKRKEEEEKEEEELSSPPLKKEEEKAGRSRRTFSDPPVFGELKRFASGRKSESWGGGELSSDDETAEFDSSSNRSGGQCSKNREADSKRSVPPVFCELKRFASGRKSECSGVVVS